MCAKVRNEAVCQRWLTRPFISSNGGESRQYTRITVVKFTILLQVQMVNFTPKQTSMVSKVSEGVSISVETFYQPDYSNPQQGEYMFAYRITIENRNNFTIQLLSRHWEIFDSCGENREVEGEGVVGEQPVLNAGQQYQYVSGCNLKSEMGKMSGTYVMENLNTKQRFRVNIPPFDLIVPSKMN